MSPFNVQLDGTDPTYPAGRDPVWNLSFRVSRRDDIVAPVPHRAVGGDGDGGVHCAVAASVKPANLKDTGDWV